MYTCGPLNISRLKEKCSEREENVLHSATGRFSCSPSRTLMENLGEDLRNPKYSPMSKVLARNYYDVVDTQKFAFKDDKFEEMKERLSRIKFVTKLRNYNLRETSFLLLTCVNYAHLQSCLDHKTTSFN